MIILDLSQVMLSNLHAQIGTHSVEVDENVLRHMILNTIRSNYMKFKNEYGELVIACDSTNNWRKKVFPYYKANRKKTRDASNLDWNKIFQSLNKVRDELKEYFPYRVIMVDTAEADDVIGALAKSFGRPLGGEPILIISGDKDFKQLQKYRNIKQYDPVRKRWLKAVNAHEFLMEHVIEGDRGDGIPNFLSPDDTFVSNSRQRKLYKAKAKQWVSALAAGKPATEVFDDETYVRNFQRNLKLISLDCIPQEIHDEVMEQYESQKDKGRSKLFNYFIKHNLKNLTESIGDF